MLEQFISREGHARVPKSYEVDNVKLGQWVGTLRTGKEALTPERIVRLEALGFVWNAHGDRFEQNMVLLERFAAREGHARVPVKHVEGEANLGSWAASLRQRREQLDPEVVARLEKIGFVWDMGAAKL
jgi:hypothetical protein